MCLAGGALGAAVTAGLGREAPARHVLALAGVMLGLALAKPVLARGTEPLGQRLALIGAGLLGVFAAGAAVTALGPAGRSPARLSNRDDG